MYLIRDSCALTLALKYKVGRKSKIYHKYGKDLAVFLKDSSGKSVRYGLKDVDVKNIVRVKDRFRPDASLLADHIARGYVKKLTASNLFQACVVCGATSDIQMHHIRRVKDSKKSTADFFTKQIGLINRKQIPLCRKHHIQVTHKCMRQEDIATFRMRLLALKGGKGKP